MTVSPPEEFLGGLGLPTTALPHPIHSPCSNVLFLRWLRLAGFSLWLWFIVIGKPLLAIGVGEAVELGHMQGPIV